MTLRLDQFLKLYSFWYLLSEMEILYQVNYIAFGTCCLKWRYFIKSTTVRNNREPFPIQFMVNALRNEEMSLDVFDYDDASDCDKLGQ